MVQTRTATLRRAEKREARRQQLIDATIDSISKRGFSGTTLATVTQTANLSHGVVNFYFETKEDLYIDTLGYLANEHYEIWHQAMLDAGPDPADQLAAIVAADFDRRLCSRKKLAVWFAFWGQPRYRSNYLKIHNEHDDQRFAELVRLCSDLIADGGYTGEDPEALARSIEATVDGLWLGLLLYPKGSKREEAHNDAKAHLARLFPRHFSKPVMKDGAASEKCEEVEVCST
ncbi:MAG: TetR family transcriptional regulator C-terminal domain-containing protein [Pseudomonadota bacterium]